MAAKRRFAEMLSIAAVSGFALTAYAPLAVADKDPYLPSQTQDSAERTIADGYIAKQINCTPDLPPELQSINWDPPGFTPNGGTGLITDVNPQLGGQFSATWEGDQWSVEYMYC